jgi:Kef-type K+ transport system membrane component KefB
MSQQEIIDAIQRIKKSQENFMVGIGILTGMVLIVYFFTFAMLVDTTTGAPVWFQAITTVAMVLVLIFLKRVGFFFARLWLGRRPGCKTVFGAIQASDLSLDEQTLASQIQQDHTQS